MATGVTYATSGVSNWDYVTPVVCTGSVNPVVCTGPCASTVSVGFQAPGGMAVTSAHVGSGGVVGTVSGPQVPLLSTNDQWYGYQEPGEGSSWYSEDGNNQGNWYGYDWSNYDQSWYNQWYGSQVASTISKKRPASVKDSCRPRRSAR